MNKKLLSIAAAGMLAAGLVGCGSSGGSSSSTTTTTTSTTQPTQVKGVDGYVMNAKLSVKYWDSETNTTKITPVDVSDSYYLLVDKKNNDKKRPGKPVYSLADLNSTVLNNVVSVVMTSQAQGKLADGSIYTQSFYDAGIPDGEYNSSVDVLIRAGVSLSAPKGYSVVTPISTIIANQVTAELAADKNETNLTNVVNAYTKDVANALGVDATTIKNVDPLTLVNSKDEKAQAYVVANAFAGAMIAKGDSTAKIFNSLKSAPAPKTAADVIGNLATAATDAGDTKVAGLLTQVKSSITADKANLETLVNSNLDKTRTLSVNKGSLKPVAIEGSPKDFNITSMTSYVGGNGYKIATTSLNNITMTLSPNDQNITNQKFTFVIRVADPKAFNAQDSNVSSLTVKVPFEVNATNGVINAAIPADAKIIYEGMNTAGTKVITGETNSTIFGTDQIISVNQNNNTITIKAQTLINDVDKNESYAFFGGGLPSDIAELQAGIVTDAAAPVSNGYYIVAPKDSIVSVGGTINETVDSMISFNIAKDLVADMRGTRTGDNLAPNNDLNVSIWQPNRTLAKTSPSVGSDTNDSTGRVVVNNNQALEINLTASTVDTWEKNTTVAFTLGDYLTDKNLTAVNTELEANSSANVVVNNAIDVNTTSTTDGNLTTSITYKVCDEFGDCNTTTAYLALNRKPIYSVKSIDNNNTAIIVFRGLDGFGDINVTGNYVQLLENNGTKINLTGTLQEVNVSNTLPNVKAKLVKLNNGVGGKDLAIEFNTTMPTNIKYNASGSDWNLSINEYNETDGIFTNNYSGADVNLTIK